MQRLYHSFFFDATAGQGLPMEKDLCYNDKNIHLGAFL